MAEYTEHDLDLLRELINIGIGVGASTLNSILSSHIDLRAPDLCILTLKELAALLQAQSSRYLTSVAMVFSGDFTGSAALVFPENAAVKLVRAVVGDEFHDEDLDSVYKGVITEIGNIVLNGVIGTMSNLARGRLQYTPPTYIELTPEGLLSGKENPISRVIYVEAAFEINRINVSGHLLIILEVVSLDNLLQAVRTEAWRE
jgi:chemotaxis protein CheC